VSVSARQQWEEGSRRLAAEAGDPVRYRQLHDLVDAVLDELRRRVGHQFTLAELADVHARADDWVRDVVRAATPPKARVGIRDAALVQDAAFHVYSRTACDYAP
jgi:hypothetical protein